MLTRPSPLGNTVTQSSTAPCLRRAVYDRLSPTRRRSPAPSLHPPTIAKDAYRRDLRVPARAHGRHAAEPCPLRSMALQRAVEEVSRWTTRSRPGPAQGFGSSGRADLRLRCGVEALTGIPDTVAVPSCAQQVAYPSKDRGLPAAPFGPVSPGALGGSLLPQRPGRHRNYGSAGRLVACVTLIPSDGRSVTLDLAAASRPRKPI